jgi:type VI secretion system secreted protein Hcp
MPIQIPELKIGAAGSAADIYLSVRTKRAGDLKGEANSKGHTNAIAAHGFQFGMSSGAAVGSTQATGRRQYKHLVVMKRLDSASTSLMSALATNDEIKELKLSLRKPGDGQDDFFTITLAGARVVGLDLDCDHSGETVERATFAFTKIEVEYRVQGATGVLGASSTFSDELLVV